MTTLTNYDALKAYTMSGNETVYVQGYLSLNDGGQGAFIWDAASTEVQNDGTIIKSSSIATGRWKRLYDGALNARWFGAKNDGTEGIAQPNAVAITNAINAAIKLNKALFIPQGNYLVSTTSGTSSININGSSTISSLDIFGEVGTKITTNITPPVTVPPTKTTQTLIKFSSGFKNLKISSIAFESTHTTTISPTHAIFFLQGPGNPGIINPQIIDCSFSGFSTALMINGSEQLLIKGCNFGAPVGHDNAQTNTDPAVHVWFISNTNGKNLSPTVTSCYATGFSGTDLSTTESKMAMDGFIFGNPNGITIDSNVIKNFSQESIFISPYDDAQNPTLIVNPTLITNNTIQYDLPVGSGLYGIRSEANNLTIANNTVINTNYGVFCYGSIRTKKCTNWRVMNNNIIIAKNGSAQRGIFIVGSSTAKADQIVVTGNHITVDNVTLTDDINLIAIADIQKALIDKNTIVITATSIPANRQLNIFRLLNALDSITISSGDVSGSYSNLYSYDSVKTNITYLEENVLFKTPDYTVVSTDFASGKPTSLVIYADSTTAAFTINLPTGTTYTGYKITVVKVNTNILNPVTITNVIGANTLVTENQSLTFAYNVASGSWWPL